VQREYIEETELLDLLKISFQFNCISINLDFAGVWFFPAASEFDFHMHPNYEIHYIKKGSGKVILNNKEYLLEKGSFYVTGPGILHKQFADSEEAMVEYGMKFDMNISEEPANYPLEEYKEVIRLLSDRNIFVTEDRNNIEQLFEVMFDEIRNKKVGYYSRLCNLVFNIIIASARNYDNNTTSYKIPIRNISNVRMNLVTSYISEHIEKNITREEIASALDLSVRQLERIVRGNTGKPTHDYILNKKIDIVKELLIRSDMTLAQISNITGFSSEFHLSKIFKKLIGESPREYKKKNI
jgi:AraC-like DNA-binding protein